MLLHWSVEILGTSVSKDYFSSNNFLLEDHVVSVVPLSSTFYSKHCITLPRREFIRTHSNPPLTQSCGAQAQYERWMQLQKKASSALRLE